MSIADLQIQFGATGSPQPITLAEQVYAAMPVGYGSVTQDRWRANPITVNGIVFTLFPGLDSNGRADLWIYAAYGEAATAQTWSAINRDVAAVDLQVSISGVAQNLFGAGTTYSYSHQRSTWLRWQSSRLPWDTTGAFINAKIAEGVFLRHDSYNVFGSLNALPANMPAVTGYQPFKTFCDIDQTGHIGDQLRGSSAGGERPNIGPVHEFQAWMIDQVAVNKNEAWLTADRLQIITDLAETAAQFPHASGFLEPVTQRLLDPSVKPHCSHENPVAWFGATGIPQPGLSYVGNTTPELNSAPNTQDGGYDNSHPFNKISFYAYHFSRDPFHMLLVQGQAVCALTYQSLNAGFRGSDGKTLRIGQDQERGMWWALQMLIHAWHVTPAGTMPKPFLDKAWFATAINNTLQFWRDGIINSTSMNPGVAGQAMQFWRVIDNLGNANGEYYASHFQEDYGSIVLAQALLLGYSAARDVAEWHAVNIQHRLDMGGSWFLNDYTLSLTGFSGYAIGPDTGTLPYSDVAGFKAWYARKTGYTNGPTITADYWTQQYGRDTYLFLGALNITREAARRGLMTLTFDPIAAEAEFRSRFVPPYTASNGNPLNYGIWSKQYFSYKGTSLAGQTDTYRSASGTPIYGGMTGT